MKETQTPVFMNPLTDYSFKKLFSEKELLIAFLNDVTPWETIVDIKYQPSEQLGASKEDRRAIFDLYCITGNDEYYIIEMQVGKQMYFKDRALFYTAFPIRKQAPRKKNWNYQLKGVYLVAVLNFILFKDEADEDFVIEEAYLMRKRTKARFSDKLNYLFVELPKFNKTPAELKTNTDRWLYCFRNMGSLNTIPEEFKDSVFEHLFDLARLEILKPTEMEAYNKSVLEYSVLQDVADCARSEGREEGEVKGREEGRSEGREKGLEEKSIEVAKRSLLKGYSIDEIAELTDLTPEQIKDIALTIQPTGHILN
ncbi:hypothetical protein FACS189411_17570 [Bacteroidia bacterium]|nr:hypothetical protein FACS189411_17570 [Bacteroidia bacterium]